MNALNELHNILRELESSGPSRNASEAIMLRVRQVLEHLGTGASYPALQFTCHWVVHTELRDSAVIFDRLTAISLALQQGGFRASSKLAASSLDLDGLREELRRLLAELGLSTSTLDDESQWYEFVCGLLACVREKPIGWPGSTCPPENKKPAKRYFEQFDLGVASASGLPTAVRTLEVFVNDGKFKVKLTTNSRVDLIATVASAKPIREYDAGLLHTTGWAQKVTVLDPATGEKGGDPAGKILRVLPVKGHRP